MLLCCTMAFLLLVGLGNLFTLSCAAGCAEAGSDSCTHSNSHGTSLVQSKVRSNIAKQLHLIEGEEDSKDQQTADEKRKGQMEQDSAKENHDMNEAEQSMLGAVQKNRMDRRTTSKSEQVLDLKIISASNLEERGWWRSRDPYVQVFVETKPGTFRETGSQSSTHTPVWNFNMHFLDHDPSDVFVFDVWDHDIGPDAHVGHVKVRFECNGTDMRTKSLPFSEGDSKDGGSLTVAYKCHVEQYFGKYEVMAEMARQIYFDNTTLSQAFQQEWTVLHSYTRKSRLKLSHDNLRLYQRGKECAMVFEGTDDKDDWATNLNQVPWKSKLCGGFWLHSGIYNELNQVTSTKEWSEVQKTLSGVECSAGIYAAGHSLGGAMAHMFAACVNAQKEYFVGNPFRVREVYSFGAPCVSKFHPLAEADGQCLKGARFFTEDERRGRRSIDPVVTLPPLSGWWHPKIKAFMLEQVDGRYEKEELACDDPKTQYQSWFSSPWKKVSLHPMKEYAKRVKSVFGR